MNIREYIQSGIIETYVLGLADQEEIAQIESLRQQHPELDQAIKDFEREVENLAMNHAVAAPPSVKQDIFNTLNLPKQNYHAGKENTGIEKTNTKKPKSIRILTYVAAASTLLFVASLLLNIYTYSKYKKLEARNQELATERSILYADNKNIQTKLNELNAGMNIMASPATIKVLLNGVPGKENNQAIVYWNKTTKEVYLQAKNLPVAPAGKQYQLWAMVDGKPVDAGVLDNCETICKLKNTERAQAFAITLEKAGGSPSPTLEQLYVMGNI